MKKQTFIALGLLLLIPMVLKLGGLLFSVINPEIAAGHPNYVRNYHLLSILKTTSMLGSAAVVLILWVLTCLFVIRAKERSSLWLLFAALGPFGFAALSMLNDHAPAEANRYARFVRGLNRFVRACYEACTLAIIWELAYEAMVLKRNLMIMYESAATGVSTAQIIDLQNASSGMWAFAEGNEVMYFVVLLYLTWPIVFNTLGRVGATLASSRAT